MIPTYRGKVDDNDPFYKLYRLADSTANNLANEEIDWIVSGGIINRR
jgi:hypothetical protein